MKKIYNKINKKNIHRSIPIRKNVLPKATEPVKNNVIGRSELLML
jgi:hypothetical protein